MQSAQIFVILFATLAAVVVGQGVTEAIAPEGASPDGCVPSTDDAFEVSIIKLESRSLKDRASCGEGSKLMTTLADGILTDGLGRTGYIASNYQFQFDAPPQAGSIYTAGFSLCANGSLALGPSTVFYQCASGTFFNLYDRGWAAQCSPIHLQAIPCGDVEDVVEPPIASVVGTKIVQTTLVTVLEDGQPQVVTKEVPIPICQIDDGQVQGHTTPCADIPVPTVVIPDSDICQIDDGQVQGHVSCLPPAPSPTGDEEAPIETGSETEETPAPTEFSPSPTDEESEPTDIPQSGASTERSSSSMIALIIGFAAALVV